MGPFISVAFFITLLQNGLGPLCDNSDLNMTVCWDVAPCNLVDIYWRSEVFTASIIRAMVLKTVIFIFVAVITLNLTSSDLRSLCCNSKFEYHYSFNILFFALLTSSPLTWHIECYYTSDSIQFINNANFLYLLYPI
jgi:hypothetical protein